MILFTVTTFLCSKIIMFILRMPSFLTSVNIFEFVAHFQPVFFETLMPKSALLESARISERAPAGSIHALLMDCFSRSFQPAFLPPCCSDSLSILLLWLFWRNDNPLRRYERLLFVVCILQRAMCVFRVYRNHFHFRIFVREWCNPTTAYFIMYLYEKSESPKFKILSCWKFGQRLISLLLNWILFDFCFFKC